METTEKTKTEATKEMHDPKTTKKGQTPKVINKWKRKPLL